MGEQSKDSARILELRTLLNEYERLYRIENAPAISDAQYDALLAELRHLEELHPELYDKNSPTVKVGDDSIEGFEKRAHLSKMLSLANVFSLDELKDFDDRLKKSISAQDELLYCVEPKIDGAGISAVYENGRLSRLLTRGNGSEGDDITKNAFVIKNLPLELKGSKVPKLLEVRGEAYMLNSDFAEIRRKQEEEFAQKSQAEFEGEVSDVSEAKSQQKKVSFYANPRNLTAGTLKLLEREKLLSRSLYAAFYSIGKMEGEGAVFQSDLPSFLNSLGLPTLNWQAKANGADEVYSQILKLDEDRKAFDFNTDGAVIKLDDMSLYALAGWTSKAPRWATAWKYKAQRARARIWQITLQVGRTGALTPVAELEDANFEGKRKPVLLSGTNVSRATLHNFEEIARKDIRLNDVVEIEKAGEIIPTVVIVDLNARKADSKAYVAPTHCPECNSELVKGVEEAVLRCINPECPEQRRRRIIHFASRGCMNIDGLGEAVITTLIERGFLRNCADIYNLTFEQLKTLTITDEAQKSAENLLKAINDSKSQDLWRLISALGIPFVGERVAKDLAMNFKSLDSLMSADASSLNSVSGVGEKIIYSILSFFKSEENLKIISRLKESGLNFEVKSTVSESAMSGKIFVLTGALESMGRSEAKRLIESYGGRVSSSVSKATDFLISNSDSSSKLTKAKELGVKIISEKEFLELLNSAQSDSNSAISDSKKAENFEQKTEAETPKKSSNTESDDSQLSFNFE